MYAQVEKTKENKGRTIGIFFTHKNSSGKSTLQFVDNRHETIKYNPIQMVGEVDAVKVVNSSKARVDGLAHPIYRNNTFDTYINSGGKTQDITTLNRQIQTYAIQQLTNMGLNTDGFYKKGYDHYVKEMVTDVIGGGNCDEISSVIIVNLMKREDLGSLGQNIYRASLKGLDSKGKPYDHVFVLTIQGNSYEGAEDKDITVTDAWNDSQIMTLQQYLEGRNHTGDVLTRANIEVGKPYNQRNKPTGQAQVELDNVLRQLKQFIEEEVRKNPSLVQKNKSDGFIELEDVEKVVKVKNDYQVKDLRD